MRHIKEPAQPVTLSVEEEAILIDEQNATMMEAQAEQADADRLLDTHDILTEAQMAITTVPEIGNVEQELIAAISEMAAAGSDVDPVDVMPVPPEGVSTEGIVDAVADRLKKLWEQIRTMINNAWEHVKKFFSNLTQALAPSKRRAEAAQKAREQEKQVDAILSSQRSAEEKAKELRALRINAERAKVRYEAGLIELPKSIAIRLALVEKEITQHDLAKQMRHTYDQLDLQFNVLAPGVADLGDVMLQAISAIIAKPVMVEEIAQKLSAAYNNRLSRLVREMHLPGKDMLGGVGANFESKRDPNFFDLEMGRVYASEISEYNNQIKTKVPALDEKNCDDIVKLALDQMHRFNASKATFMGRLDSTIKKLEEQITRLMGVNMYSALNNGNAQGEKLNLDQQNEESKRLAEAKNNIVKLARNVCASGPMTVLHLSLYASHLGDAATFYTSQSVISRTSKKVEEALAAFDKSIKETA